MFCFFASKVKALDQYSDARSFRFPVRGIRVQNRRQCQRTHCLSFKQHPQTQGWCWMPELFYQLSTGLPTVCGDKKFSYDHQTATFPDTSPV